MPINVAYEPFPALQVMGSWWAGRRATAHQVALQDAQIKLQQQGLAMQGLNQFTNTALQLTSLNQQMEMQSRQLSAQQQMSQARLDLIAKNASMQQFGMSPEELKGSYEMELEAGSVPKGTTFPQYRNIVERRRLEMLQEPQFQGYLNQWSAQNFGIPYDELSKRAESAGVGIPEYVDTFRQQQGMEQAYSQMALQQQASDYGQALRYLRYAAPGGPGKINNVLAQHDAALANLNEVRAGHYPSPLDVAGRQQYAQQAQQEYQAAVREVIETRRELSPDQAQIEEMRRNQQQDVSVYGPGGIWLGTTHTIYGQDGKPTRAFSYDNPYLRGGGGGTGWEKSMWEVAWETALLERTEAIPQYAEDGKTIMGYNYIKPTGEGIGRVRDRAGQIYDEMRGRYGAQPAQPGGYGQYGPTGVSGPPGQVAGSAGIEKMTARQVGEPGRAGPIEAPAMPEPQRDLPQLVTSQKRALAQPEELPFIVPPSDVSEEEAKRGRTQDGDWIIGGHYQMVINGRVNVYRYKGRGVWAPVLEGVEVP